MSDQTPRFHPETRADWRGWLARNYASEASVWLVSWKKASGKTRPSCDEQVSEALACPKPPAEG